ncbi:hypothetical protein HHL28_12375 [Aerophototrophica crusticola]|uniref:Uncharacterized protein n=1 Tax=Aerophototrophica crusticola TaxID=1709002 RepID=A0A858R9F5_9PROT|nr:hypothetical protein HHL28_12375 [Rhodospirillaceae bacterium B3]
MPFLDRDSFIRMLETLGDPDDATALAAARTIHARLEEAGVGWDSLLVPPPGAAPATGLDGDEPEERSPHPAAFSAGEEQDAALIDRLLDMPLSDDTRQELRDLRADLTAGEFTAEDSRYVRALAQRLMSK